MVQNFFKKFKKVVLRCYGEPLKGINHLNSNQNDGKNSQTIIFMDPEADCCRLTVQNRAGVCT